MIVWSIIDKNYKRWRRFHHYDAFQKLMYRCMARQHEDVILNLAIAGYSEHGLAIYDFKLHRFAVHRDTWWRRIWPLKIRRKLMVFLWFVTEADPNKAAGEYGEPVLASAGRDAEDSWRMLASNRQRMTGEAQDAEQLKREMTAKGYHVAKYQATPV